MNRVYHRRNQQYGNNNQRRRDPTLESIRQVQRSLPVFQFKTQIMETVIGNPITLIVGETGSGKTTQIPQYLLGWIEVTTKQKIVCTQPRTVAATSVAQRGINDPIIYTLALYLSNSPDEWQCIQCLRKGVRIKWASQWDTTSDWTGERVTAPNWST